MLRVIGEKMDEGTYRYFQIEIWKIQQSYVIHLFFADFWKSFPDFFCVVNRSVWTSGHKKSFDNFSKIQVQVV